MSGAELQLISGSIGDTRSEVCWVVITKDGRFAYVTNFGDGTVSSYEIAADRSLKLSDPVAGSTGRNDKGLRDEALSADGRYLYAIDPDAQKLFAWAVRPRRPAQTGRRVRGNPCHRGRPRGQLKYPARMLRGLRAGRARDDGRLPSAARLISLVPRCLTPHGLQKRLHDRRIATASRGSPAAHQIRLDMAQLPTDQSADHRHQMWLICAARIVVLTRIRNLRACWPRAAAWQ